jgi:hypothetical protein
MIGNKRSMSSSVLLDSNQNMASEVIGDTELMQAEVIYRRFCAASLGIDILNMVGR